MWSKKTIKREIKNPTNALKLYSESNKTITNFKLKLNFYGIISKLQQMERDQKIKNIESFNLENMIHELLQSIISVDLQNKKNLTASESAEAFDLIDKGIIDESFDLRVDKKEYSDKLVISFMIDKINTQLKTLMDHISSKDDFFLLTRCTETELNTFENILKSLLKKDFDFENIAIKIFYEKLKVWQERELEDFTFENDSIFILDFSLEIDDIFELKTPFIIREYNLKSRGMNINGERIEFISKSKDKDLPEVFISNSYYGSVTFYLGKNTFFCKTKEEALSLGKEKTKELIKVLTRKNEVLF